MTERDRLPSFPVNAGRSCQQCDDGWTCEAHSGFPWPHPTEDDPSGECAGPGMPCLNGCNALATASEMSASRHGRPL